MLSPDRRPTVGPLRGSALDGTPVNVGDFRGSVVVVNVWGSWCGPCQKEAPELESAYRTLAPKGVRFLGIDVRESGPQAPIAFQQAYGITYPSLFDAGSDYLLALRGSAAANAIPTTVVLDPQGRVAARILGATTKTTLVDVVQDVLAARPATA